MNTSNGEANLLSQALSNTVNTLKGKNAKHDALVEILKHIPNQEFYSAELLSAIKTLYPAPKTGNTYWSVLCDYCNKKDVREYMTGIYVQSDSVLTSTTGWGFCRVTTKEHWLQVGAMYEQNKKAKVIKSENVTFPDIDRVLEKATSVDINLNEGVLSNHKDDYSFEWVLTVNDKAVHFDYNQVKKIQKILPEGKARFYNNGIVNMLFVEGYFDGAFIELIITAKYVA